MAKVSQMGAQERCLKLEALASLAELLATWRSDYEQQLLQRTKAQGRVFDFVKGLRFSAQLIYVIREWLYQYRLQAHWGQVIADNGGVLSPECDVIIHDHGHIRSWNDGKPDQVMDFKFIKRSTVLVVISCKSLLIAIGKEHRDYCERMKPYVGKTKLWLFSECVPKGKEAKLKRDASDAGYHRFWYLYSWDTKNSQKQEDRSSWADFLGKVEHLGKTARKATQRS